MDSGTKSSKLPLGDSAENIELGVSEKVLVTNETLVNDSTFLWTPQANSVATGIFFTLAGLSFLTLLYFAFRAMRLRRRNYKVRRYGVIASREDVEMTPLENEDDDEDSTVFDISMKNLAKS